MKLNLQHKRAKKKPKSSKQALARSIFAVVPVRKLITNKRAVSAVISNMILIAAVIVVGFVALGYARSTSNNYVAEYGQIVNSDIAKLKETLAFEYVHYDATRKVLDIYFMNAGNINVNITGVFLSTSAEKFDFWIYDLNNVEQTDYVLGIGEERHIVLNVDLLSGTYTVKLTTMRGLIFANNFAF